MKLLEYPSSGSRVFHADRRTDGQTDRLVDRHDEGNSRYSQFCERPIKVILCSITFPKIVPFMR